MVLLLQYSQKLSQIYTNKLARLLFEIKTQTKFTHFSISGFQISPGRQNFVGSVPRLGHSGLSSAKPDEENAKTNISVDIYRITKNNSNFTNTPKY